MTVRREEHTQPIHRHPYMMKSRALFFIALALLIPGIALFTFPTRYQEPAKIYPATVNRDCAPWDGAAFTMSIPYEAGSVIIISIWQPPDIILPVKFSFPDESGRIGNATFLLRFSYSVQLTGKVFFWRVDRERSIEGGFDFVTESGQRLNGKFKAEWGNEIVYCG